jgi:hypothetical protein
MHHRRTDIAVIEPAGRTPAVLLARRAVRLDGCRERGDRSSRGLPFGGMHVRRGRAGALPRFAIRLTAGLLTAAAGVSGFGHTNELAIRHHQAGLAVAGVPVSMDHSPLAE